MQLSETDFFRQWGASDAFDDSLTFAWFEWRRSQGLEWNPGGEPYTVTYDWHTDEVVAKSKFGEERFSAKGILYTPTEDRFSMLWHSSFYDGPLAGVSKYKGKFVWYEIHDSSYDNISNVWTYDVYELSDEQYEYELGWHQYFTDSVKNSNDQSKYDKYYKDRGARDNPDYTKNVHIGEFDECLFDRTYKDEE